MPRPLRDELVAWAVSGRPNEACGILAGTAPHADGGSPTRFYPISNALASPYRYLLAPDEQLRALSAIDDAAQVVWGIFHSHVRSPAVPSPTDVEHAAFADGVPAYPGTLYLICSLADPDAPEVRVWALDGGSPVEVILRVE